MLVCYSVSKTYVIEKICLFVIPSKIYVTLSSKPMFFCLTQKPHPVRRPPLCVRGAGGEAVPQERENQINTLVLKDINFTINIIELSYYRTIDTLNQPLKMPPWYRKPHLPCLWSTFFLFLFLFLLFIICLFIFLPQRFVGVCCQLSLQFCTRREDHTRLNRLCLKSFFSFRPFTRQRNAH